MQAVEFPQQQSVETPPTAPNSTTREQTRWYRFCAICGTHMRGYPSTLDRHCRRQHGGENAGFLEPRQQPSRPRYSNFAEFLLEPSLQLLEVPGFKQKKAGKPKSTNDAKIGTKTPGMNPSHSSQQRPQPAEPKSCCQSNDEGGDCSQLDSQAAALPCKRSHKTA